MHNLPSEQFKKYKKLLMNGIELFRILQLFTIWNSSDGNNIKPQGQSSS